MFQLAALVALLVLSCLLNWFGKPPDQVESVEVGSGVGFELDGDLVGAEHFTLEPSLSDDIVEHWVALVVVVGEKV
jgi:hypothetical protein